MLDSLKSLLDEQIKDLYNAENQLLKALPKMAKKASNENLRAAFEGHLEETREHVERLASVAAMLESKPGGKVCKAMQGLLEEGKEVLEQGGEDAVVDAALIAAAQRVEHYEIAAYTSACSMAQQLGATKIVKVLQETLDEERGADEALGAISAGEVLPATGVMAEEDEAAPPVKEQRAPRREAPAAKRRS
ncbi:MAG TPA: ferritin-like domain-containing protein [Phycisphaerales bacterium]|nr:ferritin-like domain-containing protein [Phycisphaerales bacterium]